MGGVKVLIPPLFATAWYLKQYPEVARSGKDPVLDFLGDGHRQGRSPCPEFNTAYYLSRYPDVDESGENPLVHYLTAGCGKAQSQFLV